MIFRFFQATATSFWCTMYMLVEIFSSGPGQIRLKYRIFKIIMQCFYSLQRFHPVGYNTFCWQSRYIYILNKCVHPSTIHYGCAFHEIYGKYRMYILDVIQMDVLWEYFLVERIAAN